MCNIKMSLFMAILATTLAKISENKNLTNFREWACLKKTDGARVLYMRWPDHLPKNKHLHGHDLWFDRLVFIHSDGNFDEINEEYNLQKPPAGRNLSDLDITVNGVIISDDQILTSFNPFRDKIKYHFTRHFTAVCYLKARRVQGRDNDHLMYGTVPNHVACARAVVPVKEEDSPLVIWHGTKTEQRQHSPVHDLMVLRLEAPLKDFIPTHVPLEDYLKPKTINTYVTCGPIKTVLAKKGDMLKEDMKFAMMGHILNYSSLRTGRNSYVDWYNAGEPVLADCDEWLPRLWGWFICLNNYHNLPRLASGAMLYSDGKLFGVGSFTLNKGKNSMLAFTDVREYEHLILNTCTVEDQERKT